MADASEDTTFQRPENMPVDQWKAVYEPYRKAYKRAHNSAGMVARTIDKNRRLLATAKESLKQFVEQWQRSQQVSQRIDHVAEQAVTHHNAEMSILAEIRDAVVRPSPPPVAPPAPVAVEQSDLCSLCMEELKAPHVFVLQCSHKYHYDCMLGLYHHHRQLCGLCRAPWTEQDCAVARILANAGQRGIFAWGDKGGSYTFLGMESCSEGTALVLRSTNDPCTVERAPLTLLRHYVFPDWVPKPFSFCSGVRPEVGDTVRLVLTSSRTITGNFCGYSSEGYVFYNEKLHVVGYDGGYHINDHFGVARGDIRRIETP